VPAPLRICISCGVTYEREGEFTKLAELATEGRSTATTILTTTLVRLLREHSGLPTEAQKLLSFTDNRQDASLQSGHLNDFAQTTMLRAALYAAVSRAGEDGVGSDRIAQAVVKELALAPTDYASNKDVEFLPPVDAALRDVVGYRVFRDLRRGWRLNAPNLEETGLLAVRYEYLDEACAQDSLWAGNAILADENAAARRRLALEVLDEARRGLAIKTRYLEELELDVIRNASHQHLDPPWGFDTDTEERPIAGTHAVVGGRLSEVGTGTVGLTPNTRVGKRVRSGAWRTVKARLDKDEVLGVLTATVTALAKAGIVERETIKLRRKETVEGFRINGGALRWLPGDGAATEDVSGVDAAKVNAFFHDLYIQAASTFHGIEAREHTAQVPAQTRQDRERAFRAGKLPIVFCSPTMELGIDIADLNVVNMRNVPPSPANYAQRSGRAGRSGQPAFVLTYCTSMSPHDQYFFRRREQLVGGAVTPPRLDLANEDLVRAHLQAVWLAETGQSLGQGLPDVLDLDDTKLPLKESVSQSIAFPAVRERATTAARGVMAQVHGDVDPPWLTAD